MNAPVRPWHLALLPLVLPANYLLAVLRHEGSHSLVALAFGAVVAEFHVWPPRGVNLSWITIGFPVRPSPWAVPLQAGAPYAVAVALLAGSVWMIGRLPSGLLRANVVVGGVVFPCAELVTNVLAYWFGPNDFFWALGTQAPAARVGVTLVAGAIVLAAAASTTRALAQDR
jgi:hypothetical protein